MDRRRHERRHLAYRCAWRRMACAGAVLALFVAGGTAAGAASAAANDPWSGRYAASELGQTAESPTREHEKVTIRAAKDEGAQRGYWLLTGPGMPSEGIRLHPVDGAEYEGLIDTAATLTCLGGGELFVCHAGPGSVAISDGGAGVVLKTGPDAETGGEGDTYAVESGFFIVSPGLGVVALKRLEPDAEEKD